MKLQSTISPSEIPEYRELFQNLGSQRLLKLVVRILNGISQFIGYPIGIVIPEDAKEFRGDQESLRALRLLAKLRDAGLIESFRYELHQYPDEPPSHVTLTHLAAIKRFGFTGKGAHLFDKSATLWPALGEAVERHVTQFNYPKEGEYVDASWNTLKGPRADIFDIAGFDESMRKRGHPDFILAYDRDSEFRWVGTTELPSQRRIWAPLQWFSFSHIQQYIHKNGTRKGKKDPEPMLSVPITTGFAAGQNRTDATFRGLLEVIERDAFMIYWLNQMPAKRIDPASFGERRFDELIKISKQYNLEVHLLYLQTDMPAHTICSVVIDRSGVGPALIIGAKSGLELSDTAFGALGETLAQRSLYRGMMTGRKDEEVPEDILKIDHVGRMLYWFDLSRLKDIEVFIGGKLVSAEDLPTYEYTNSIAENLSKLLKAFTEKGYQVFSRELLSKKLIDLTEGLSVVAVRVPQMQTLYLEESLRSIGGDRLRSIPKMLGYDVSDAEEDPFCKEPHPFP